MASKKRERKNDKKRTKLEKRRRKLEKKLREIEEWLKKHPKPSKTATGSAGKKPRAKSGAVRRVLKKAKGPVQKVKPAARRTARKAPKPTKGDAARTAPKQAQRPVQKVKPTAKKTARKAPKAKAAAPSGSKSLGRRKRARRAPSATRATGTPEATASYSQETSPPEVFPTSNAAPETTGDLLPEQPT